MMEESFTVEVHCVSGEKLKIDNCVDFGYQKIGEHTYCFYAQMANDKNKTFFPADSVNAIGKAGNLK